MWKASPVSRSCQLLVLQFKNLSPFLRNKIVCGALTNGHGWIFLLIKLNDNYEAASYTESQLIQLTYTLDCDDFQMVISKLWPDVIAAILLHWVSSL